MRQLCSRSFSPRLSVVPRRGVPGGASQRLYSKLTTQGKTTKKKARCERAPKARADTTANRQPFFSFDHLIRLRHHIRWDREADLLSCLQIDDELKLRRLLHGQITWVCPFENFANVSGGASVQVRYIRAIRHEAARLWPFSVSIHGGKAILRGKIHNALE